MGDGAQMTPAEYVAKIDELVSGGRDEDALELAARFGPELTPRLSPEDFFHVAGLLEGAELVASSATLLQTLHRRGSRTTIRR